MSQFDFFHNKTTKKVKTLFPYTFPLSFSNGPSATSSVHAAGKVEKLYRQDGTMAYEGELLNRKKSSRKRSFLIAQLKQKKIYMRNKSLMACWKEKGVSIYYNGSVYLVGTFENSKLTGKGVQYTEDGAKLCEGDSVDDHLCGQRTNLQ